MTDRFKIEAFLKQIFGQGHDLAIQKHINDFNQISINLPISNINQFLKHQYLLDILDPHYQFHAKLLFISESKDKFIIDFLYN